MADDNSKFGIEVSVDTKKATKALDDLDKKAKKTNDTLNADKKINIDAGNTDATLNQINDEVKKISTSLSDVETKTSAAFSVGKLVLWYEVLKKVASVAMSVANYVLDAAQDMTALSNTAQGLSVSTNTLKAWETTFKSMGFNAKEADAALSSIQDKLTSQLLNPSVQVASAFSMMGINLRKSNGDLRDAVDVTEELLGKFKSFKPEYAIALGAQLGISRNIVMQAIKHPEYAHTLAQQIDNPVVTENQVDKAREAVKKSAVLGADIDKDMNNGLSVLDDTLTNKILPPLTIIANALSTITGPAVQGAMHVIGSKFKIGGAESLLKEGLSKGGQALSNGIHNAAQYVSQKAGMYELQKAGERIGMSKSEIVAMMKIAAAEDPKFRNGPSDIKNSTAYGFLQIQPKTMRGIAKNNPGFDPNDWSSDNQARAFQLLNKEFRSVAKQTGVDPNSVAQYRAFHNLGQSAYRKALEIKKTNPNATYGQVYSATDKSGLSTKGNPSLVNQMFPSAGLNIPAANTPSASQSAAINNSMVNNTTSSNVSSSTTIGQVHVSANNPQEFAHALSNHRDLDRALNMTGRLA